MNGEVFKSKRFWVAVAGVLAVVFEDKLPIEPEQLQLLVLTLASWILGDSLRATVPGEVTRIRE